MGKINVLSFAVANLIAAGEVVDRPSSVIKELLENAIDSGADKITVEIQNGGVTYMRVTDNGCGISSEDLPVAIRRHATSKIKDATDLDSILTLGFRGEALAAIASVSDMRIISKTADAPTGSMLSASGGNILGVTERPAANGTSVIVENLFANVPARRKFLKKDATESLAVSAMVEKIALSRPDIAFKLIIDGNEKIQTVGDGQLKNAIYCIFGRDFASKLIETKIEIDGVKVHGYVGRPDNVKANRNYQNFFINGRYVKTKTALAAIEQAYTSYISSDKFPCCVLFIDINPNTVDVNVHPAKLEVKFSNERPVFEAIFYAARNALESDTARPEVKLSALKKSAVPQNLGSRISDMTSPIEDGPKESLKKRQIESELYITTTKPKDTFAHITAEQYLAEYMKDKVNERQKEPLTVNDVKKEPIANGEKNAHTEGAKKVEQDDHTIETNLNSQHLVETPEKPVKKLYYRIIGEAFNSYVLVEKDDKLLLIDKHAAHERIIFEHLKAQMLSQDVGGSQLLMLPIEVMMTSEEIQTLCEYKKEIEAVGFEFTAGRYTANVTAIPEGIQSDAVGDMLTVMADRIKNNTGTVKLTRDIIFEKALYQASCKAAIKAGREYPKEYVEWLVEKLMELPDITVCPHGRPVAMELTKRNLDYQFERS